MARHAPSPRGFSLVELLVTISLVVILLAILLPSLGRTVAVQRSATCMTNQKDLMTGWYNYTTEHGGNLMGAYTSPGGWVSSGSEEAALTAGTMFPYLEKTELYRCPSDKYNHNRSYSFNNFLRGEESSWYWPVTPFKKALKNIHTIFTPSMQLALMEENDPRPSGYPRRWNNGSWVIQPAWATPPENDKWIDYVASYHGTGDNVAFADLHVEFWTYEDKRTQQLGDGGSHFYAYHPNNPDLKRYQSVYTAGSPN